MKVFPRVSGFLSASKRLYLYIRQTGVRKVSFRCMYELQRRTGMLRLRFPARRGRQRIPELAEWRKQAGKFFFDGKPPLEFPDQYLATDSRQVLEQTVRAIYANEYRLFHGQSYVVADWHTNPLTGFRYNKNQHWSSIRDLDSAAGDIKFVWEKSRFTFLIPLIRHDLFCGKDHSDLVLARIDHWIRTNPVNLGPNWMCSQEISIRVLNWLFALQFYKESPNLTTALFAEITQSIYDQMRHVAGNLGFSRKFVQNNHTLTEATALFTTGLLLPFFQESAKWKTLGLKVFTEEVVRQIGEDGSYCQHSMNYHRMVVQLFSWVIRLADLNHVKPDPEIARRATACVRFLRTFQDESSGWLPNYGPNDGTLLFHLSSAHHRDFRPQLHALASLLHIDHRPADEEASWFLAFDRRLRGFSENKSQGATAFPDSGYYVVRDGTAVLFLRCGAYKTRPFQADNNHLDLWWNGENVLRDAGTYSYNGEPDDDCAATGCHNTIVIGSENQMQKGTRFIWLNWIGQASGRCWETEEAFFMEGSFEGFKHINNTAIQHRRLVTKRKGQLYLTVEDWIPDLPKGQTVSQVWHLCPGFHDKYTIEAFDHNAESLMPVDAQGWYAETYGQRVESPKRTFSGQLSYIKTIIKHTHEDFTDTSILPAGW